MDETVSMKEIIKDASSSITKEEKEGVNKRFLIMYHLATLQMNLGMEIQEILSKHNKYKFTIKHNHNQIKKLIRESVNFAVSQKLTDKELDDMSEDYDSIETMIKKFAGIPIE